MEPKDSLCFVFGHSNKVTEKVVCETLAHFALYVAHFPVDETSTHVDGEVYRPQLDVR